MQQPLFSIIIPVYNAVETLQAAADSILGQSVRDLELLLVDDGSRDGSIDLCRKLAEQDSRVRVFSQKNGGICAARNAGLAQAKGMYVGFCDDDDCYLPNALQRAENLIRETGAEMIRGGYELQRQTDAGYMVTLPHAEGSPCRLPAGKDGTAYLQFLSNSGPQFVWNTFYRRDFLQDIRFDENCRFGLEDFLFNAEVYAHNAGAVFDPAPFYRHYERSDSTSAATVRAVAARVQTLPNWVRAEYRAAESRCEDGRFADVWAARKAEFITFLMHQLRDCHASGAVCRRAWRTLRRALRDTDGKSGALDFLRVAGHNKKQAVATFLYATHAQGLYAYLPNKEEKLLK